MPEPEAPRPRRAPAAGIVLAAGAVLLVVILALALGRPQFGTPEIANPSLNAPPGQPEAAANRPPEAPANVPGKAVANQPAAHVSNGPPAETSPPAQVDPNELPPEHPEIPVSTGPQLSLQWLGHACFYLHSPGQATAVTDPFDPKSTGLPSPDTGAHLVTVSADRPDHSFTGVVHGFAGEKREVVRGRAAQWKDLKVTPVETEPGRFAYVFEAAGLRVAHLGHLTGPLAADRIKQLGKIDILLVSAGGEGITPKDAGAAAAAIAPRVVIPMAYSTPGMTGPEARLRPVEEFIAATNFAVTPKELDTLLIGPGELPAGPEIWTLKLRR